MAHSVDFITSNEQHVRLEIHEGRLPANMAYEELLRIEKAQHENTRQRLLEAYQKIRELSAKSS